jgi:hypothetical protein
MQSHRTAIIWCSLWTASPVLRFSAISARSSTDCGSMMEKKPARSARAVFGVENFLGGLF